MNFRDPTPGELKGEIDALRLLLDERFTRLSEALVLAKHTADAKALAEQTIAVADNLRSRVQALELQRSETHGGETERSAFTARVFSVAIALAGAVATVVSVVIHAIYGRPQ